MSTESHHHVARAVSIRTLKADIKKVEGFNAKLAVALTSGIGTMACAYAFSLLALSGLPAALRPGGSGFVQWFAQTFLQLVLLSVIMVGQNVQAQAGDHRAILTEQHTETIIDQLKVDTAGGLGDAVRLIVNEIRSLKDTPAPEPQKSSVKEQS